MDHSPDHLGKTEARAGTTPGVARYVLIFGLLLVLIAFITILVIYMR
ncbi:MAG TPA: hypothetical protein VEZ41_14595 [Allosphingosinicella sp.]|jgi:hypothetical protein|nr:hypothetical protein [Allosphingosinicella sp.]